MSIEEKERTLDKRIREYEIAINEFKKLNKELKICKEKYNENNQRIIKIRSELERIYNEEA